MAKPIIGNLLADWFSAGKFDDGNGEKILKRLIRLASEFGAEIPSELVGSCLFYRPGVRENIYLYMRKTSPNMRALHLVLQYLGSDYATDDASFVEFANELVDSTCQFDQLALDKIEALVNRMVAQKAENMLYAAFKILSKIGNAELISRHIESTYDHWKTDYFNGRVIGSLWPIVFETERQATYESMLKRSRNAGAMEVVNYLMLVGNNRDEFMSIRKIITASNNSFPNKISHSKFIVLHSILQGHAVGLEEKQELRLRHWAATKDPYYASVLDPSTSRPGSVAAG
jgi:hypothetical protein